MKRARHVPGQSDLFKFEAVYYFPLDRRGALVRDTARIMALKPTAKKRDYFIRNELSRHFAQLLFVEKLDRDEAVRQVERFRDRVVGEYTRIRFFTLVRDDHSGDAA
jgi:hypothetical protein